MKRVIALVLVALGGRPVELAAAQQPGPLSADIVAAWKKAGAQVGWHGPNNAAFRAARPGEKGKKGDVPAFRFSKWKDKLLEELPAPEQAFGLDLHGTSLTDAGLKEVARLKLLQTLQLGNTKVTDAGLKELAGLEQLQLLSLSGTKVTGAGLKELAALKQLRILSLYKTLVTDAELKELAALKQLRSLNLGSTKVTNTGLKELAKRTQLRSLDLSFGKVTEKGAEELRRALPKTRIVRNPPWEKKIYTSSKGQRLPYRLLVPEEHDPKKAYPLIVFMNGIGARGADNEKQIKGIPWFSASKNRKKYPCFVVAPQCPGTKTFPYWNQCVRSGLVMGVIEEVEKSYRIDSARIYATGLSDGGYGVWHLLDVYPHKLAAAVPISVWECPVPAARIAHVPIWVFHGEKDKPKWTRGMVAALEKAGGKPKYTEYKNAGHGIWDRAYNDPKLFEWLFEQKRQP